MKSELEIKRPVFLSAEWRKLAIANYQIDSKLLKPYLPAFTEFDLWNNTCYISLVGFLFLNTKLKGVAIPFHQNFEEVNLRFYVRYKENDTWKRGVVFINEFVPKPTLTLVANLIYKEPYRTLKMNHNWLIENDKLNVRYTWIYKKKENSFLINTTTKTSSLVPNSKEEFITEHYWGYTKFNERESGEYAVEHPRWEMYAIDKYSIDVDFGSLYGKAFDFLSNEKPASVMLAEGSPIIVRSKTTIK